MVIIVDQEVCYNIPLSRLPSYRIFPAAGRPPTRIIDRFDIGGRPLEHAFQLFHLQRSVSTSCALHRLTIHNKLEGSMQATALKSWCHSSDLMRWGAGIQAAGASLLRWWLVKSNGRTMATVDRTRGRQAPYFADSLDELREIWHPFREVNAVVSDGPPICAVHKNKDIFPLSVWTLRPVSAVLPGPYLNRLSFEQLPPQSCAEAACVT